MEKLHTFLKERKGFDNPKWNGERTLELLRSIRSSPALSERYATIYNQAVVLLVSYFGSAIADIFRHGAARGLERNDPDILEAELKIRVGEVVGLGSSASEQIGDLLIQKDGITFQDMQSTHRAFQKYFKVDLETDETVKNVIVGQACRHALVHDGGKANHRIIRQIRNATPRTLKPNLSQGEQIRFSISEVEMLSNEMRTYIQTLVTKMADG
ncbi:hypothetical protein [Solimonas marina]|uniref:RiboL-PSP-HEPN domain-containing protein n=1 Tax=Solimonas marina TaxID=2714601 RepID=A0A969WGD6_9GAMM|nr:hypothetical protein [Solimonas marina]NKF24796.1 hypothetical protein [Solimonas marina]